MTLLDAPKYDAAGARRRRNILVVLVVMAVACVFGTWWLWNWPEEHRVNSFFAAVQSGDLPNAYGIWNHDPDWRQHPDSYKQYRFDRFEKDWGVRSDYGQIRSHKVVISRSWGNGVVMGEDINGAKTPVFLWVDRKTKQISFSPVELYRPIWDTNLR